MAKSDLTTISKHLNNKNIIQNDLFNQAYHNKNFLNMPMPSNKELEEKNEFLGTIKIDESWKKALKNEFLKQYFKELIDKVKLAYTHKLIYPAGKNIFQAFNLCKYENIRVVIIGQDPYHGPNQANGLCFSVNEGIEMPPSLKNIFKEIHSDIGKEIPKSGNLEKWAKQGVLLLNSILTVEAKNPGSHKDFGWQIFTDSVIETISKEKNNIVFLLWGSYAIKKGQKIDRTKHLVLTSPHPSPFSANQGFLGNKHFSKTNNYLSSHKLKTIDW